MKATGIVRRIDDLGRVVVPKEIRRTLRIREGDPLEIFTDRQGEIILKKYSPIGELSIFAKEYADRYCLYHLGVSLYFSPQYSMIRYPIFITSFQQKGTDGTMPLLFVKYYCSYSFQYPSVSKISFTSSLYSTFAET